MLRSLLWYARSATLAGRAPIRAEHGYSDPVWRPPSVPFVSITGPLAVALDTERETRGPRTALVQHAGHLLGAELPVGATAGGSLTLRIDRAFELTAALPPALVDAAAASALQAALRAAVSGGGLVLMPGTPAPDATRLAELRRLTVRWDAARRRVLVASGRYGAVAAPERSSVELVGGTAATALGLTAGRPADGRTVRHQLPAPRAVNVDVRVDLWATTQGDLSAMLESLLRAVPTRGHIPLRPALLAENLAIGATSLRLAAPASPTRREAALHLEVAAGPRCRVSGATVALTGAPAPAAPSWTTQPPRFELPPAASASVTVLPAPLLPDPLRSTQPASRGLAVSLVVRLISALPAGEERPLFALDAVVDGVPRRVLGLTLAAVGAALQLRAASELTDGLAAATASAAWSVAPAIFTNAVALHLLLLGPEGELQLFVDGVVATALPGTVLAPGLPTLRDDAVLTLGGPGGGSLLVDQVLVLTEPFGPADPRLRTAATPAARFAPGDQIQIAASTDGFTPSDQRVTATVESVAGDTLVVSPPLAMAFSAGRSLLFREDVFLQQLNVGRRDDFVNRLYRASVDYRVAALLDDDLSDTSAPLVETPRAEVRAVPPPPPVAPAPTPSAPAPVGPTDLRHPGAIGHVANPTPPDTLTSPP